MASPHRGSALGDLNASEYPKSLPRTPLLETYPTDDVSRPTKPWRPWTLTTKGLAPTALFTALLIVALALLQWQNARNGALFFAQTEDGFSNTDLFLYRYLPTIIIVLYGIIWSWIDLDIKRLEPWFQMADSKGADGASSLLLQYPVQFLPLVPFRAASKKQWIVFSTSSIMLIVVWAVTPLQNGIFSTSVINLTMAVDVRATTGLIPLADQVAGLSGSFMMTGYGLAWLGQQPPAFTTSSYALAPFQDLQAITGSVPASQNQTITAPTTLYQTSLDCAPPVNISFSAGPSALSAAFDDGKGCATNFLLSFPTSGFPDESAVWASHYIGYWDDPALQRDLALAGCPRTSNHTFLAIWAKDDNSTKTFNTASEASALFCTPSYHVQSVNATISLTDSSVLSVVPLGAKSALSDDLFNVTQFEYLLGVGVAPGTFLDAGLQTDPGRFTDLSNTKIVHQDTQLRELDIVVPANNMIGYAVGLSDRKLEILTDPVELQRAFEKAHQLLFALAVHDLMPSSGDSSTGVGVVNSTLQAVRLVPVFAIFTQALLFIILLFTCYLLWSSPRRNNCLSTDPNSLAEIMSMADDPKIQEILSQSDIATDQGLARAISTRRFHVESNGAGLKSKLHILNEADSPTRPDYFAPQEHTSHPKLVRPMEYSWLLGLPFILCLTAMVVGLSIVRRKGLLENGLSLPSSSSFVQNLLTNALPALLATLLEPFWILLNRVACIMRPMEELRMGRATARRSLLLKYNSIPPQLNVWRALKAHHFLLATLSFIALLANVLTVAFSGLFSQNAIFRGQDASLKSTLLPRVFSHLPYLQGQSIGNNTFNDVSADAYLVALSNFSGGTTLPPWVSTHHFFLPLEIDQSDGPNSRRYNMQTTGYGAELECQDMTTSDSDQMIDFGFNSTATSANIQTSHKQEDGSVLQCIPAFNVEAGVRLSGVPVGRKGFEFAGSMVDVNDNDRRERGDSFASGFCSNVVFKAWVRADLRMETTVGQQNSSRNVLSPVTMDNVEGTFITCRPRLKSTNFNLTVSQAGIVLDATEIGQPTYDDSTTNLTYLLRETTDLISGRSTRTLWHNGTIASDFPQQMISALMNSTSFLDAALPPPDFVAASTVLNDLFARVFAIQMSLRSTLLLPAPLDAPPIPAQLQVFETRIFMSEAMFLIAITILCIDVLVAIIFYVCAPPAFLPRMPTTIGSQLAFFAASHVIGDVREAGGDLRELDRKGYRYGYGSYVGTDGKAHVGVEREPFVTGIDVGSKGAGPKERWSPRFWDRKKGEKVRGTDEGG